MIDKAVSLQLLFDKIFLFVSCFHFFDAVCLVQFVSVSPEDI